MWFDHRAVPIVLGAVLVDTIGFGIVMPVLPGLITQLGHVGLAEATRIAGYLLVVFAATQFIAGPILGNLGDRFGRRPVLIAAMFAFAGDYALMALAPTLAWLFIGRAVAGATGAVYGPASAVLADVTPPEKRSAVFGLIGAAFGLGFVLGPALGGLLSGFGARAPFIAAAVLALINALTMLTFMPETLARADRRPFRLGQANIVGAFRPLFHAGEAAPLLAAWFLWTLAHNVYPATWAFWGAMQFGWNGRVIGLSLALAGIVMALFQGFIVPRYVGRLGERRALLLGLCAGATAFALYPIARNFWQVLAIFCISAVSGFAMPSFNGLLSRLVGPSRQGAFQGGIGAMQSVASIVAPLVLTQVLAMGAARGFYGGAFLTAALMAAAAALTVAMLVPRKVASGTAVA